MKSCIVVLSTIICSFNAWFNMFILKSMKTQHQYPIYFRKVICLTFHWFIQSCCWNNCKAFAKTTYLLSFEIFFCFLFTLYSPAGRFRTHVTVSGLTLVLQVIICHHFTVLSTLIIVFSYVRKYIRLLFYYL